MKAKKIIITAAFALLMLGLKAQDHYEYATVVYSNNGNAGPLNLAKSQISISQEGKYTATEVKVKEGNVITNLAPVLEVVNKMSSEGWEVYANSTQSAGVMCVYYFLRKKKS